MREQWIKFIFTVNSYRSKS